ncbi:MAG: hypothetical protein J6Q78_02410 [Clostridia bacterium]|nr:hypothetical protein [Clostridia bacterium]
MLKGILQKKKILLAIAALVALCYIFYHVIGLFGDEMTTIITGMSTENTYLDSDGYIFRDETRLYSSNKGVADYRVEDGTKISEGTTLAAVYENGGDMGTLKKIKFIDDEIRTLKKSTLEGYGVNDLPNIREDINEAYYALIDDLANRDTEELLVHIDSLKAGLNSFDYASKGSDSSVGESLEILEKAKAEIISNSGSYINETSDVGGYFYSYTDGYEDIFTIDAANSISGDSFDAMTETMGSSDDSGRRCYGKLVEHTLWKLCMEIPEEKIIYFEIGNSYEMTFSSNSGITLPMTLETTVYDEEDESYILVFYTDRLPAGFVFNRCQNVKICVNSISGIYVPKSAVHRDGNKIFVYVLKGSVVRYRNIDVLYEDREYYLVTPHENEEEWEMYLGENELLILNGKNLFDGRIMD